MARLLYSAAVILWFVFALSPGFSVHAEPIAYFKQPNVKYDQSITTPDAFIGYGLGDKPVRHDILVGYLRSLARQSDRIEAQTIGYSHEGRPILSFVISSPENLANIDTIKENHKQRLTAGGAGGEEGPAVVWLNYGVHGAESAGMDASIPTLYHLAAAQGNEIDTMLQETVIVMIAIFNPDGHSRRVNHVYTFNGATPNIDPAHESHNLWVEARTNHYWFDLNRDWLLLTQPESNAWIKVWHDWKPNVSADFHEMGSESTYYFHPGEQKRKNPLIPDRERELLSKIAEEHIAWLDKAGELYTSEEGFDNFYIGKGSTYPSINGSVGILFEAAAARGGAIDTQNGLRTYAQNIRIHFNTSLTTIAGTYKNRASLLSYQKEFFDGAKKAAANDERKAYVFTAKNDAARAHAFVRLLQSHKIETYRLARNLTLDDYLYEAETSFIVPLNQAQYTMIRGVFDQVTEFEEAIFYDVSGWTLPLAYDLDYTELKTSGFNQDLLGEAVTTLSIDHEAPKKASYGYIFSWSNYYAPRALTRFFKVGARPRVLMDTKTLNIKGRDIRFERGSIFVPANSREDNVSTIDGDKLHRTAIEASALDGLEVFALDSGNAAAGVGDLGSRGSVMTLTQPKPLLLFDDGGTRYGSGQIWHLLDKKMNVALTMRRRSELTRLPLENYTHIFLPGGGGLGEAETNQLRDWVNAGGILVATKGSAVWAQGNVLPRRNQNKNEGAGTRANNGKSNGTTKADEQTKERYDYAQKSILDAEHLIGGALFGSDIDVSHPLGFGYADRNIATMKATTQTLNLSTDPYANVAQYRSEPLLSGYASQKRLDEIADTPMLVAERLGRGGLVLFADDPSFRATFLGTDKLFLNALFFGDLYERARQ